VQVTNTFLRALPGCTQIDARRPILTVRRASGRTPQAWKLVEARGRAEAQRLFGAQAASAQGLGIEKRAQVGDNESMGSGDTTRLTLLLRLRDRADTVSWQEFHERYGQLLYRYARARGATHDVAEDVVQEVELYLFKAMPGFEYDARNGRFRTYLRSAVMHALGRRAQREARQPAKLDPEALDYAACAAEAEQDAQWEREWQLHRLRWAMQAIAGDFEPNTLRAFELHVLAGKAVNETATEVGLSPASVYQAKSRVLKALKEKLATLDPDADV
jgi:RNA polymerase sigma-70 factor (ECF subfamily)